jgi:hypothetical protein
MPPLDSVTVNISASSNVPWSGGNFSSPVTVNGKFAVLVNNASTIAGDTIRPFLNNASTPTSTLPPLQRYGEGLGVMRVNGSYMTTASAFGGGADYEFLVAPRVLFSYTAGVTAATPTVCTNGVGTFSNTSAPIGVLEHRQFNFIQFYKTWRAPLTVTTSLASMPPLDSLYNWTFTGSPTTLSYQKNPSVTFTASGTQTGQLSTVYRPSVNGGFVPSFTDVASGNLNVNTSAAPVIAITGNTAICSGNSTTLTASGNPTFTWTIPATTSPSIIVNPTGSTVYTVSADNGGCVSTRTIMVVVSSPANVSVTTSKACVSKVYTLTASGANTYSWSNAATSSSITAVSTTSGVVQYTVTGTNAGCPPSVVVVPVTVNDLPNVTLTAAKNKVCKNDGTNNQTVALTGVPSGGIYSGLNVVGAVFTPNTTGTVTATYSYTDTGTTCSKSATTSIVVENCTGLIMNALNQDVNVYPNPSANGLVHVKNLDGVNTLQLFNILGMKLSEIVTDKGDYTFDLSSKANGNYFIRIIDAGGNSKTVKIVNQN